MHASCLKVLCQIVPHNKFVLCFDRDIEDAVEEIPSMPEQFRYGANRIVETLKPLVARGLSAVLLFGVPSQLPKVKNQTFVVKFPEVAMCRNIFLK